MACYTSQRKRCASYQTTSSERGKLSKYIGAASRISVWNFFVFKSNFSRIFEFIFHLHFIVTLFYLQNFKIDISLEKRRTSRGIAITTKDCTFNFEGFLKLSQGVYSSACVDVCLFVYVPIVCKERRLPFALLTKYLSGNCAKNTPTAVHHHHTVRFSPLLSSINSFSLFLSHSSHTHARINHSFFLTHSPFRSI